MNSKIERCQLLLDRCTTLIANCDNKASFALAIAGVLIAELIPDVMSKTNGFLFSNFALILFLISAVLFCITLIARIKSTGKKDFIRASMESISEEEHYLKDLEKQIDTSANIYFEKCYWFNFGLILLLAGILLLIASVILSAV